MLYSENLPYYLLSTKQLWKQHRIESKFASNVQLIAANGTIFEGVPSTKQYTIDGLIGSAKVEEAQLEQPKGLADIDDDQHTASNSEIFRQYWHKKAQLYSTFAPHPKPH